MDKAVRRVFCGLSLGLLTTLSSCVVNSDNPAMPQQPGSYKVMVISDIHLFDMDRISHEGEAWEKRLLLEDKNYAYCAASMEALVQKVKSQNVKYVIVPGDLTKDGEVINHEFAASFFRKMEEAGANVFVINGNHDISNADAKEFTAEGEFPIETATSADFKRIYHDFGYAEAISQETEGLSYSVDMGKDIRLIMLDSNIYNDSKADPHQETAGTLKPSTMAWAKEQCAKAIAEGRTPVGVLHHGLVEHIPNIQTVFLSEFLADNYKEARRELAAAGMHIVLTGHNHAQDIASVEEDGKPFYDIQTGSLVTLCPLRYIDIDTEKRTMSLESQVIDQLADGTMLFETLLENSFWGTRRNFMQLIESNLRKMGYAGEKLEATMQMLTTLPVSHDGSYLLLDALADAYLVHRQGDETMTEKVQEVCSILQGYADLTSMTGDTASAQLLLMVKNLYAGLYVDSPSADNTLVISY